MVEKNVGEFSRLTLSLYRIALEKSLHEFQDAALDLLRTKLPFDSCMWGTATHTNSGIDIHSIHLNNQPKEMIESYESIKHLDAAAAAVSHSPRATMVFNSASLFTAPEQRPFAEFNKQFDQRNYFITSTLNPDTRFTHWVTLFRAKSEAHGTEDERCLLAEIAPHLQQSLEHNRVAHLARLKSTFFPAKGSAICDLRGTVYHIEPYFEEALRCEWLISQSSKLPRVLLEHFASGARKYVGRSRVITCSVEKDLMFLHGRPHQLADELSPKELAVARLMSKGLTHRQVALELERAPATVRNHMQAIYGKLQINSIAGLIDQLRLIAD